MKFDYISDMHIDYNFMANPYGEFANHRTLSRLSLVDISFYNWQKYKQSDILVIAGDISNSHLITSLMLKEACLYYKHVIFTDGNHDHYSTKPNFNRFDVEDFFSKLHQLDEYKNITYLDSKTSIIIDDTTFVGGCGWYNWMSEPNMGRSEQYDIWKLQSRDASAIVFDELPDILASKHSDNIYNSIKEAVTENVVVITHTVPSRNGLMQNIPLEWSMNNGSYHNTLFDRLWNDEVVANKIKCWCFGHTHERKEFIDGPYNVRFITNPRGYRNEFSEERNLIQITI